MLLIPAIDLKDGKCVRLRQGRMDDETIFSDDPVAMAARWVEAGARRLHLVDLNGAFEGKPVNGEVVHAIAEAFPEVPIHPVCLGGIERTLPRNSRIPVPFSIEIRRLPSVTGRELVSIHGAGARKAIAADLEARVRSGLQERP